MLIAARGRPPRDAPVPGPGRWPSVTVVVPAYKEAAIIADKVADLRANGYDGALEVIVVADDAPTAAAARATPAVVVEPGRRMGKATAINIGVERATGEVIVLTDANALMDAGSLARMVRWLELPDVAGVAGEKHVR